MPLWRQRPPHSPRPITVGGRRGVQLSEATRNHQCDVVLLLAAAAELLDRANDCLEKGFHRKRRMPSKGVQQMGLTKLFPIGVCGFGDSIRIEYQRVTSSKLHF